MKNLIRILAVMAVVGSLAFVADPAPAVHNAGGAVPVEPHQRVPSAAVVQPAVPCVVSGEVVPGASGGTPHQLLDTATPDIPGYLASHTHYSFIQTLIACSDFPAGTGVTANGGNDGHLIDLERPVGNTPNHQPNAHHGSTNESGWSHCSGYDNDADGSCDAATSDDWVHDAESNACVAAGADSGKGDIALPAPAFGDTGWVKYIRIGVALYVWGCFDTPAVPAIAANPFFSAVLAIFPPAVLSGGVVGNPAFPLCLVPAIPVVNPAPGSCGFSIVGVAFRGPGWLPV